ncbi:formamidopyrimidine-DNA glycosylase isoform X2 [Rhizophagus clarus]|uniref:Formamidopyrimidine-DNA glycosylase isoform X2 n=1 Tax=Rhizophagus clarus TaxID=94130 RepID=A0A8H3QY06_9GLOM|nr:formamidopyrimidine-DNA glycosylase isoform X2 [Rhizophagus clarus]
MPELPEVHRAERACNANVVGKKIVKVEVQEDKLVFGSISNGEFERNLLNKFVVNTGRWGKYFYFEMNESPNPVFHFGMTGDINFKDQGAFSYRRKRPNNDPNEWPPKFWKFILTFEDPSNASSERTVMAFSDDLILCKTCRRFRNSRANTLSKEQIETLHEKLVYVCKTAVDVNAESQLFPSSWLFHYRWDKRNKNGAFMPNGEQIIFETVGGRTTAIVPSVQKLLDGTTNSHLHASTSTLIRQKRKITAVDDETSNIESTKVIKENNKEKKQRIEIELNEQDLVESFVKGSGNGGQKINTTSNCVDLKHIPTGIRVQCQKTRSLQQNRNIARKILIERLDNYYNGELSKFNLKKEKIRKKQAKKKKRTKEKYGVINKSVKENEDFEEDINNNMNNKENSKI